MDRVYNQNPRLLIPLPASLVSAIDQSRGSMSRQEYFHLLFETADQCQLGEFDSDANPPYNSRQRPIGLSNQLNFEHSLISLPESVVRSIDQARDELSRAQYIRLIMATAEKANHDLASQTDPQTNTTNTPTQQHSSSNSNSEQSEKESPLTQKDSSTQSSHKSSINSGNTPHKELEQTDSQELEPQSSLPNTHPETENNQSATSEPEGHAVETGDKPLKKSGITVGTFATSWAIAFGTYGAGDITSTLFSLSSGSAETNPVMRAALEIHPAVMVGVKLMILVVLFYLTRHRLLNDGFGPNEGIMLLSVPAILSLVGSYATVTNILLLPNNLKLYAAVSSILGALAAGALVLLYEDFIATNETKRWDDQIHPEVTPSN